MNSFEELKEEYNKNTLVVDTGDWNWLMATIDLARNAIGAIEEDIEALGDNRITQATIDSVREVLDRIGI